MNLSTMDNGLNKMLVHSMKTVKYTNIQYAEFLLQVKCFCPNGNYNLHHIQ